jgi:hypothetical protein
MKARLFIVSVITILSLCTSAYPAQEGPIAWWKFDGGSAADSIGGTQDEIRGNFKFVEGVSGKALKFDGLTTSVTRKADKAPKLGQTFTIEAWVALGAYPWNWCPIVSQAEFGKSGCCFGIDSNGRVGLCFSAGGKWHICRSEIRPELKAAVGPKVDLDLRKWYHLAAVCDSSNSVTIYKNGDKVASLPLEGTIEYAPQMDLLIGRNHENMAPTHPVRAFATHPSRYSFDGIIDEIKIYSRALSAEEIAAAFEGAKPKDKPDIPERRFPTAPDSGRFGAFHTRLKYYDEWDALWRTSDYADIVVQFDEHPIKVMFWRGSRYSPCWVTENGKWMADQSREEGGGGIEGAQGCCEHMSDAQCRHSHVRLIENNDARVVINWRYALIDTLYRQAGVDEVTGWGLWGDEVYTIYPDGVGVRHVLPGKGGWQETIFFNEPGTTPEDNCQLEAITLVNLKGESRSYSWEKGYPKFDLAQPLIQMTNLRSKYRPFLVFRPESRMSVFNTEVRPEYSHFPWWNHWPVAQVASDGRHAQAADRAAHSSLVWGRPRGGAALYGLTNKPAVSLLPLAKSWNNPPELKIAAQTFTGEGYDYKQRAYVINRKSPGSDLEFTLAASEDSPLVNPAFVVRNWGEKKARLQINGKTVERGENFRYGHRHTLEGTDLIVWIKTESVEALRISIVPAEP